MGITSYNIKELENYLTKYSENNNKDIYSIQLAIKVYKILEDMEGLENEKIESILYLINKILNINISNLNKNNIEDEYKVIINTINTRNFDENIKNKLIICVNELRKYYLNEKSITI